LEEGMDAEKLVKERSELELHSTDKGQFIIGLEVKEVRDLWDKFIEVDNAIILILEKRKLVKKLFEKANIDLSDFYLEKMEGESERVYNPLPYLISF
jgi:hypothetical protein